jgi:hypothetical protein
MLERQCVIDLETNVQVKEISPIALIGHRPDDQRHPLHFLQRRFIARVQNQLTMAPQLSRIDLDRQRSARA